MPPGSTKVVTYTSHKWPQSMQMTYFQRKNELIIDQGCILWGLRVVIPQKFWERLLNEIHKGMCRIKALARSYLWWPQLNKAIETKVKSCEVCVTVQNSPPAIHFMLGIGHFWIWQHVPIDFAKKGNHDFQVLIDSHPKWKCWNANYHCRKDMWSALLNFCTLWVSRRACKWQQTSDHCICIPKNF